MSISDLLPGAGPSRALAEALAGVRGLAEVLWSARSDDELVEAVELVQQLASALAVVEAGAVAEADARELAKRRLHYASTGDWLTHTRGLRRGEGRRRLVRARALTGPLARTRQGLLDGAVSPEQADIIVTSVDSLSSGELVRARGERLLVTEAARLDASELARAGRHLVHVVDPDGTDRRLERALEREERAAHAGRFLAISEDGAGGVRIKGRGSAEDGALIRAALLPMTCPSPAADDDSGQPAHDPRDHGARLWDALVGVAQNALDTDLPPETHGTSPRLLVTLDAETLKAGLNAAGVGTTADGIELSPGVLRRLACDAEILPAVLGSGCEILDVGRAHRLVTPAIWTALVLRDRHCTFPACTRPPLMCHAHHLTHWITGGTTSLDNLALLCGPPPHHPPHTLENTTQPPRPKTRIPASTQTWSRFQMDPISTPIWLVPDPDSANAGASASEPT